MSTADDRHAFQRGMILDIFKPERGDASNGGVSSRCTQVTVVQVIDMTPPDGHRLRSLPRDCRVFEPQADRPAAALVVRRFGRDSTIVHVVPTDAHSATALMMGGCYVATSDSRWARVVEAELGHAFYGALPLHDRWEG